MSGTDSLSKGVFSFKKKGVSPRCSSPKKKSPRKRAKPSASSFQAPSLESLPFLYHDIKSISSRILDSVQKSSFDSVLVEVSEYLGLPLVPKKGSSTLPTGVIVTGVNLPDHGEFFSCLLHEIREKRTQHVALIKSSSLTTLRALVANIVKQLMNIDSDKEDVKKKDLLFPVFKEWYAKRYGSKESESLPPPCVIILEDFDSFSDETSQELLYNIRELSGDLPIILLLGVATSVDTVHRSLPTDLTSSLVIRKFSSHSSSQTFAEVVERVILSNRDIPFKLGSRVFRLLYDIFLFHDFSIKNFLSGYKFCLLEHMSSPLGKLLRRSVSQLSHAELETYRRCLSFRKYVEADIPGRAPLLIDDELFKVCLKECLEDLESSTDRFNLGVSVIFNIVSNLQRNPIGKYMHTIYLSALSEDFSQTSEYKEMLQLLSFTEKTDLESIINQIMDTLKGVNSEEKLFKELQSLLVKLSNHKVSSEPEVPMEEQPPSPKTEQTTEFKTRLSRVQWQEALKANLMKEKRKTVYEGIRSEFLSSLQSYFSETLIPPSSLPFSEVKFFNNSSLVKQHLIGDHRMSIQRALAYPGDYLKNEKLSKVERFEIPKLLPDLSIAYKLYSECGKLINLYDWLQCWLSVIKGEDENDSGSEEVLQARFSQAVAELQFLGFIKSSKRKTDHVSRLTWGAY